MARIIIEPDWNAGCGRACLGADRTDGPERGPRHQIRVVMEQIRDPRLDTTLKVAMERRRVGNEFRCAGGTDRRLEQRDRFGGENAGCSRGDPIDRWTIVLVRRNRHALLVLANVAYRFEAMTSAKFCCGVCAKEARENVPLRAGDVERRPSEPCRLRQTAREPERIGDRADHVRFEIIRTAVRTKVRLYIL